MKILIINGSPKGQYSITRQTYLYLRKLHPNHEWDELQVGKHVRSLEKELTEWMAGDRATLCPTLQRITDAELIIFCYPVYTFLVPAQLHRFIELLKQTGIDLSGHTATQLLTSRHFFDTTAMRFVEDNAHDMGLRMLDAFSADMEDLTREKGQLQARQWWHMLMWQLEGCRPAAAGNRRIAIVADLQEDDTELAQLVDRFRQALPYGSDLYNIREFPFTSGCICCFKCSKEGQCSMPDGFDHWLREEIQEKHDSIVYAFRIQDHSMGSRFKMFDDRQFCNGHRTVTENMPMAYIAAGDLSREPNLKTVIEARSDMGGNYLAGIVSAEEEIEGTVRRLSWALEEQYTRPRTFFGVGGSKIFRDLIWQMRGLMRADHRFFKEHGLYDFPQKLWLQSLFTYLIGFMMSNQKVRKKMGNKINEGMVSGYQKVIDAAEPEEEK